MAGQEVAEFYIFYNGGYWSSRVAFCDSCPDSQYNGNIIYQAENVTFTISGRGCELNFKSIFPEFNVFSGFTTASPLNLLFTLPVKSCVFHIGDVIITQDSFKSPLFINGYPAVVYITGTGTEAVYAQ